MLAMILRLAMSGLGERTGSRLTRLLLARIEKQIKFISKSTEALKSSLLRQVRCETILSFDVLLD